MIWGNPWHAQALARCPARLQLYLGKEEVASSFTFIAKCSLLNSNKSNSRTTKIVWTLEKLTTDFPEDTKTKPNHLKWLVSIKVAAFFIFCLGGDVRPAGSKGFRSCVYLLLYFLQKHLSPFSPTQVVDPRHGTPFVFFFFFFFFFCSKTDT